VGPVQGLRNSEKNNDTCASPMEGCIIKTDGLLEVVPAFLRDFYLRMSFLVSSFVGLAILGLAQGCGHDHSHGHQPPPPKIQLTPPTRQLVWGDINIIHTTDSHGWLLGHQKTSFPEPNYRCVTPIPVILCQAVELLLPVLIWVILLHSLVT